MHDQNPHHPIGLGLISSLHGCLATAAEILLNFPPDERVAILNYLSVGILEGRGLKHDNALLAVYQPRSKRANSKDTDQGEAVDPSYARRCYRNDKKVYTRCAPMIEASYARYIAEDLFWRRANLPHSFVDASFICAAYGCPVPVAEAVLQYLLSRNCIEKSTANAYRFAEVAVLATHDTHFGRVRLCSEARALFEGGQIQVKNAVANDGLQFTTGTRGRLRIQRYLDLTQDTDVAPIRSSLRALEKASIKRAGLTPAMAKPTIAFLGFFAEDGPGSESTWMNRTATTAGPLNYPRLYRYFLDAEAIQSLIDGTFHSTMEIIKDRIAKMAGDVSVDKHDSQKYRVSFLLKKI